MLIAAVIAHVWDLATFLIAVPWVGAEAEIGPIGLVYSQYGALGASLWKLGAFLVAVLALYIGAKKHPRAASAGWLALVCVGTVGALMNTYAIYQVLDFLS